MRNLLPTARPAQRTMIAAVVRTIVARPDADAARIRLWAVAEQLSAVAGRRQQRIRKLLDRTGHGWRDTPISSRYGGYVYPDRFT